MTTTEERIFKRLKLIKKTFKERHSLPKDSKNIFIEEYLTKPIKEVRDFRNRVYFKSLEDLFSTLLNKTIYLDESALGYDVDEFFLCYSDNKIIAGVYQKPFGDNIYLDLSAKFSITDINYKEWYYKKGKE